MIARSCRPEVRLFIGGPYLLVDIDCAFQVFRSSLLSLDQMVAMHGRGNCDLGKSSTHELEDDHLSCSILTSNSIRSQVEIRLAADNFLLFWVVQVAIQHFLRICQWPLETLLNNIDVVRQFSVT